MTNETHGNIIFNVENCRAENSMKDWVDCLSPEQAHVCGFSESSGGNRYFCEHPHRFTFVEITKKLKSKLVPPPNVSQSDNQE